VEEEIVAWGITLCFARNTTDEIGGVKDTLLSGPFRLKRIPAKVSGK
jgi:hypothetical protein